jgi:hypothetical protein
MVLSAFAKYNENYGEEIFKIELIEVMKPGFLFSMLWFPNF